jgi:hypothetical protein
MPAPGFPGGVAQLAERFGRIEEVVGSIPIASTGYLRNGTYRRIPAVDPRPVAPCR